MCARVCVCVQGFDPAIVERLPEWEFHVDTVSIKYGSREPTLVRNTLRQLTQLRAPGANVDLTLGGLSSELLDTFADMAPQLKYLCLRIRLTRKCTTMAAEFHAGYTNAYLQRILANRGGRLLHSSDLLCYAHCTIWVSAHR